MQKVILIRDTEKGIKWLIWSEETMIKEIIGYYSLELQDNNQCELNNLCVLPRYRHRHIWIYKTIIGNVSLLS